MPETLSVYAGPPSASSGVGQSRHLVQHRRGGDPALQHGAVDGARQLRLVVVRVEGVDRLDDGVAPQIGRVDERRTPVAVAAYERLFLHQVRMGDQQVAHLRHVVLPDGVDQLAGQHQPGPARRLVAACQHELRVGELRRRGVEVLRVELGEIGERRRFAAARGAQQLFGLLLQLFEVGNDGKPAAGHTSSLALPGVRSLGRKGGS